MNARVFDWVFISICRLGYILFEWPKKPRIRYCDKGDITAQMAHEDFLKRSKQLAVPKRKT